MWLLGESAGRWRALGDARSCGGFTIRWAIEQPRRASASTDGSVGRAGTRGAVAACSRDAATACVGGRCSDGSLSCGVRVRSQRRRSAPPKRLRMASRQHGDTRTQRATSLANLWQALCAPHHTCLARAECRAAPSKTPGSVCREARFPLRLVGLVPCYCGRDRTGVDRRCLFALRLPPWRRLAGSGALRSRHEGTHVRFPLMLRVAGRSRAMRAGY